MAEVSIEVVEGEGAAAKVDEVDVEKSDLSDLSQAETRPED